MPLISILGLGVGGAGGGGPWDPGDLTNPNATLEMWDGTALFGGEPDPTVGGGQWTGNATGYWTELSDDATVGTVADKSGLIGEGVTYGTFEDMCVAHGGDVAVPLNTTTGWTLGSNWSINTGTEKLIGAGTNTTSFASYTVPASYVTDGGWYRVSFRYTLTSADYLGVTLGDTSGSYDRNVGGASGVTDYYANMLIKADGNDELHFESGLIAANGSIWDISIQAVPGNHMYSNGGLATIGTDEFGLRYINSTGDKYYYTGYDITLPTRITVAALYKPAVGDQAEPIPGVFGISNTTNFDDGLFVGGTAASENELYIPGAFVESGGFEALYDAGAFDTTAQFVEADYNMTDEAYAVYKNNVSVATGTGVQLPVWNDATNRLSLMTIPMGAATLRDYVGRVYACYLYEGARDSGNYTHVDTETGGLLFDPVADLTTTTRGMVVDMWDPSSHFIGIPGVIAAAPTATGENVGFVMSKDNFSTHNSAAALIAGVTDLITTPDLSASTGWTVSDAGVVIGSGVAAFDGTADNQSLTDAGAIDTDTEWHLVEVVLSAYTSGDFRIRVGEGGGAQTAYFTPTGTGTFYLWIKSDTAAGVSDDFVFEGNVTPNRFIGSVDSISVKEIPGTHIRAEATADRPTRETDASGVWHLSSVGADYMSTEGSLTWAEDRTITVMAKADAGSQDQYDGIVAVNDGSGGGGQWTFGNTNNAGTYQFGIYRPFITNLWNSASDETGVNIWDIEDKESTDQMRVRKNGTQVLALTARGSGDDVNTGGHQLFFWSSSNEGEFSSADIYGVYGYDGTPVDNLVNWLNMNTGSQI